MSDQSDLRGLQEYHAPTAHTAVIVHLAPRWIAVSEGLPEWTVITDSMAYSETVWVVVKLPGGRRFMQFGKWCHNLQAGIQRWSIPQLSATDYTVTHWQPLPDLPEVDR